MFFISGEGFASAMVIGTKREKGKSTEHKTESAGIMCLPLRRTPEARRVLFFISCIHNQVIKSSPVKHLLYTFTSCTSCVQLWKGTSQEKWFRVAFLGRRFLVPNINE